MQQGAQRKAAAFYSDVSGESDAMTLNDKCLACNGRILAARMRVHLLDEIYAVIGWNR